MKLFLEFVLLHLAFQFQNDLFLGEKLETGAYIVKGNSSIFYMLIKARTPKTQPPPLLLWIYGGPGCSGMYAAFAGELGPFNLTDMPESHLTLIDYPWTQYYDIIFIDQPLGIGYSQEADPSELCNSTDCNANDILIFLNKFGLNHPYYANSPFYIVGVSYAGHTIPKVAEYLLRSSSSLKLSGVAIGNGWFDPLNQLYGMPNFAFANRLISWFQYILSYGCFIVDQILMKMHFDSIAEYLMDDVCTGIILDELDKRDIDAYNIKDTSYSPYAENLIYFLNLPEIREALNTTDRPYFEGKDSICDYDKIYDLYDLDEVTTVVPSIQYLLESGIKVLLFAGDLDYVCSWMQMEDWLKKLQWPGLERYLSMEYKAYVLNGREVGKYKRVDNLAYFTIYEAGHEAMIEQPEAMRNLMDMMVDGVLFKD